MDTMPAPLAGTVGTAVEGAGASPVGYPEVLVADVVGTKLEENEG